MIDMRVRMANSGVMFRSSVGRPDGVGNSRIWGANTPTAGRLQQLYEERGAFFEQGGTRDLLATNLGANEAFVATSMLNRTQLSETQTLVMDMFRKLRPADFGGLGPGSGQAALMAPGAVPWQDQEMGFQLAEAVRLLNLIEKSLSGRN